MPKKLLQKIMVAEEKLKQNDTLRFISSSLLQNNIWHLNRHSASRAVFIGLFWAFIPMPLQMVPAAFCSVFFKANLPLSVGLVWLTNPFTMPPIFYATYKLGSMILDLPPIPFESIHWNSLDDLIMLIWQPVLLGSVIISISSASIGYTIVQFFWRLQIINHYKKRKLRPHNNKNN